MDENAHVKQPKTKKPVIREIVTETSALMGKQGTVPTMLCSLLFCLAATYLTLCLSTLLFALASIFPLTEYGVALFSDLFSGIGLLLFFLLVIPLWLGRLRMSGLLWQGQLPVGRELFYYFTSWRRLLRAWRIGFVALMGAILPIGLIFILYQVSYFLRPGAVLLGYTIGVAMLGVVLLLLSGFWLLFVGIAVGNEQMPVRHALEHALCAGKRHFFAVTRFTLRSLLWLLLGVATVGVLVLLYSAHFYNLSYLRLCMALCPKEEEIQ